MTTATRLLATALLLAASPLSAQQAGDPAPPGVGVHPFRTAAAVRVYARPDTTSQVVKVIEPEAWIDLTAVNAQRWATLIQYGTVVGFVLDPKERAPQASPAPAAQTKAEITGFASIPWGATRAEIVRRRGTPITTVPDGDVVIVGYKDRVVSHEGTAAFFVSPRHGLIGGGYSFPFGGGDACERIFDALEKALTERYPSIEPNQDRSNTSQLSFCDGVMIGKAQARTTWEDEKNGSLILLRLAPEGDAVTLFYASRLGRSLIRAKQAEETQEKL